MLLLITGNNAINSGILQPFSDSEPNAILYIVVTAASMDTCNASFMCALLQLVRSLQAPRSYFRRPHLCVCRVRLRRAVADAPIAVHEHVPSKQHDDKHAEPEEHESEVLCRLRAERLCEPLNGTRQALDSISSGVTCMLSSN